MSIFAVGDIHGCSVALQTLLSVVPLQADDTLVTLGDYGDRGPDTKGVISALLLFGQSHHLVALRGNHDQMMLAARTDKQAKREWEQVGRAATLASYGGMEAVPDSHWRFLENHCLSYWECDTHFFVHGGVYPDVPLWEQPAHELYWARFEYAQPHMSGKIMVCGHTSQKNGLPKNLGYAVCIDTWVYGSGWLSCLDIGTGNVWQADQDGEHRQFLLTDLTGNNWAKG